MNKHLKCIHYGLYKELKLLRKLTIEEIQKYSFDSQYKLFLFLFYKYYDILKNYDNNIFNNISYILTCGNLKMLKYYESRDFTYESNKLNYYFALSACNKNPRFIILKYLLAKGADINYIHNYRNAYMSAAKCNNIKLLKYLEENGININYCNKYNINVYLYCISDAKLSTLKYLESRGIDIYKKNYYSMTAYLIAAYWTKSIKILKHLESKGFHIYVKDNSNRNILELVLSYSNSKRIHKYLLKKYDSKRINKYNKEKYKNILSHKNNSIKLIYMIN